jgi:hypothetical protein
MSLYLPEDAPALTRATLRASRSVQALTAAGTRFLVFDPGLADDDVLLLHFFFQPPGSGQRVSAVCTSGLCETAQRQPRAWCFDELELVVAYYSPGFSTTFLQHLLLLSRDVRDWLREPAQPAFGFGDSIEHFPLVGDARSALLIPPLPELVLSGLRPFSTLPSTMPLRDWLNPAALRAAGPFGFVQAVSLFPAEYEHVRATADGFRFFLEHLLASDAELALGNDVSFKILDMNRTAAL